MLRTKLFYFAKKNKIEDRLQPLMKVRLKMTTPDYYNEVCDGVHSTYPMLTQLYSVEVGSIEFIHLFQKIEIGYNKFNAARIAYYKLLKDTGGDPHSCWLTDEFNNGIYCLDEKYNSIEDAVKEYKEMYGLASKCID